MNRIEYQKKQEEIEQDYKNRKKLLDKEFADFNNKIKVGDIIETDKIKIKVESMDYAQIFYDYPQFTYSGIRLTKSNKPYSKRDTHRLWQQNIILVNGKPYSYQEEIK